MVSWDTNVPVPFEKASRRVQTVLKSHSACLLLAALLECLARRERKFSLLSGVRSSITMSQKKTGCLVAKENC